MWLGLQILCWIRVTRVGILILILILEEYISMFHHWILCGYRFIIYDLYYVEVHSFYTHFIERCWILSSNFSASIEVIVWFIAFILIMCIMRIVMWILSHSWIPGVNTTWSGFMTFLVYCCIQFVYILLRIFTSFFISDIGL